MAAELARVLTASKVKRVGIDELLTRAYALDPGMLGDPKGPSRFRAALDELVAAGQASLPAEGSRSGWDARSRPPLPMWVKRTEMAPPPLPRPGQRVWPHALERAGRLAARQDEHRLLAHIAEWLRDTPDPEPVPVQERSAELFGDEKALDRYAKTRLFTSGSLTFDLLACYEPPLPFASQHIPGTGPTALLVLENLATYTSFLTAARELPRGSRPDLHVAWGHGGEFSRSVRSVPLLVPAPTALYYFGDLDLAGLRMAVRAAAVATEDRLPAIRPATRCYAYLLAGGSGWHRPDTSNPGAATDHDTLCSWLPANMSPAVSDLLSARQRIPQERLGLSALRTNPALLTASPGP